ncbi:sugar-binding domain-containing protein [Thermoanaerobacter sp. YS13]|uniref:glycosyl hydrolase 2 galactose-binding domain-containing protein n=1 Tax=Thermoanaerobacter sp. YS13 TaxID=1511746 RepID=UPI00068FFEB2|nr:sugar-binding domain-containing protein [Thermoanaerobacter sp. YS13]
MKIDLNGKWEYRPIAHTRICANRDLIESTEGLPKAGIMDVPNNWEIAGIHDFTGKIEFIRYFDVKLDDIQDKLPFLCFEGIDYFAEIYLNEKYIGYHEGYFQPFEFNIKGLLKEQNILKVIVNSPMEDPETVWPNNKVLIKGVLNHHDARP